MDSGSRLHRYVCQGSEVIDLEIVSQPIQQPVDQVPYPSTVPFTQHYNTPQYHGSQQGSTRSTPTPAFMSTNSPPPPQLTDPAILSAAPLTTPHNNGISTYISPVPPSNPFRNQQGMNLQQQKPPKQKAKMTSPTPLLPPDTEADEYDDSSSESSVNSNPYTADHMKKSNIPFEGPSKHQKTYRHSSNMKRNNDRSSPSRRRNNPRQNTRNQGFPSQGIESDGWATEDITDFKDTDFDFQANLERFDKALVFDEIRQNDYTLPSDRLVAFNKVGSLKGRPVASNGQIKYSNKEMVLDSKSSEWDFSDDNDQDLHCMDSNNNTEDEASIKNISAVFSLPHAPIPYSRRPSRPQLPADSIQLITANNKKPCPCASPVQMVELERLASEAFGISEGILTENAGRGVARLAIQSLGGPSRFSYGNHNSRPLIIVFVGNSRTGARALAAARHLANRQVRIIVVAVGCIDDQLLQRGNSNGGADEVLPEVRTQIKALESCKGKIVTQFDQLIGELNMIDSPTELVIDGFQGYQTTLDDLWEDDATTVKACIDWANNHQKASVVSIDIPSGVDSATGLSYSNSTQPINAKWILSCGLPLTGIQNAYLTGTVSQGDWSHYVVDVGFPRGSLQKGSLRRFGQVWFGAEWILSLDVVFLNNH